jgi:signal transduction histidine kinase
LDRDKLQQVFINLFMNAIQAMDRDGTLRVTSHRSTPDPVLLGPQARAMGLDTGYPAIEVRVADIGPGVRPDHLELLFDPFFTTKPTGKGTGLGLSVSRNIVKLHGGSIDIANRPQGGAVATLLFRITADPYEQATHPAGG